MSGFDAPRSARFSAALDRLRAAVLAGAHAPDRLLPGERDLAASIAVSRTTLRRMLAILADEGLLTHRQGVGTFVTAPAAPPPAAFSPKAEAARLAGFSEWVRGLGFVPSSRDITQRVGEPTPAEAMLLACAPDAPVVRLDRIRCVDGVPVAFESALLPAWALARGTVVEGSLHEALTRNGVMPVRALQRIGAGIARAREAVSLGVSAGSAVVRLARTDYCADGRCCIYTRSTVCGDRFDFLLELTPAMPRPWLAPVAD